MPIDQTELLVRYDVWLMKLVNDQRNGWLASKADILRISLVAQLKALEGEAAGLLDRSAHCH